MSAADLIATERLDLVPMTPAFLQSTVTGASEAAAAILGVRIPPAWWQEADFAALRLRQFEAGATSQPWLPRAIRLRDAAVMVGHIGFHTPPCPDYLKELCPTGVEFGYTVYPEHRRKGYAWEATRGLMAWARRTHEVRRFIVSVSPANVASLGLVARLGFRRIGAHIDEVDGPEDIFELVFAGESP